ncbi:hypothetical protein [Halobacillus amylolyticus]|uniref:Uncharacterized protein n=1 Tax=Halobacillus amylolyticus TaxID=2932259 RepID=A0ABY4HAF2_9BACI|nr:hypothetical protein [Halobacillus amylolyticus]UOR10385.1 hypothetical protein MUO15_11845 [Halobacillus amylolyticus]
MYSNEVMKGIRSALNKEASAATDSYIASLTKVEAMDLYLQDYGEKISPSEIRRLILDIFRINLEGISGLERSRISLYSKGQWMTQQPTDLFVVSTGPDDIDVKIYPGEYFVEKTGLTAIPYELAKKLKSLGYREDQNQEGALYYCNPAYTAVANSFKKQTMGAIAETVQKHYQEL